MFIDTNDKTIAFHPDALRTITRYLDEIVAAIPSTDRQALTRATALAQILTPGFGKAARVTPDGDDSLFVAEYVDLDAERADYVFGCIAHTDGTIGVHS